MYSVIHYLVSQWQGILALVLMIIGILVFIHGIQCSANTTFSSNKEHKGTYQAGGIILFLAGLVALVITLVLSQRPVTPEQYHHITHQVKTAPKSLKPQLHSYLNKHSDLTQMDYHNFESMYHQLHQKYRKRKLSTTQQSTLS